MSKAKRIFVVGLAVLVAISMNPNTAEAGAKKALTVTVKNASVSGSRKVVEKKKKAQVVVKYGGKNVTKKAKYKTSNKKVAAVSKKGVITAKKAGNCTIRVSYKGKKKNIHVRVANPVVKVPSPGGGGSGNHSPGSVGSGNNDSGGNNTSGSGTGNSSPGNGSENGNESGTGGSPGSSGNTGSGNGSTGTGNGITGGDPDCTHAWQAKTENKWVEDWKYVKSRIVHCNCGATFVSSMYSQAATEEEQKHELNHLLKGESTSKWFENTEEWMDCGSYQDVTYQVCTKCGAVKN